MIFTSCLSPLGSVQFVEYIEFDEWMTLRSTNMKFIMLRSHKQCYQYFSLHVAHFNSSFAHIWVCVIYWLISSLLLSSSNQIRAVVEWRNHNTSPSPRIDKPQVCHLLDSAVQNTGCSIQLLLSSRWIASLCVILRSHNEKAWRLFRLLKFHSIDLTYKMRFCWKQDCNYYTHLPSN